MKWYSITPITWKRLLLACLFITVAAALRIWPLEALETRLAWLTFYPAVMMAAIYGGVIAGILATCLSCIIIIFFWPILAVQPFIQEIADWLGMGVFFLTSAMISVVAEAMRRANLKAKQAQEEAQLANHAKSVFLANMSHELRTPLNAILGYSQLMQRDELLPLTHKNYLKTINQSGEHLLSLINDILILAKIESKGTPLELVNFNFYGLIHELHSLFQPQIIEKKIAFIIMGLEDIPQYVYGDEKKLRIVLINLIGNAIKFTNTGSVTLWLSYDQKKSDQKFLTIKVEDTGVGISAEESKKLFQYFVQTESGRNSKTGTGLGLAISQNYVKIMGGEISASSAVKRGTVFRFSIPLTVGQEVHAHTLSNGQYITAIKEGYKVPRILVAEDTEENRYLLVELLSTVGFELKEAKNGQEAVEMFLTWHPDLIWMDIRMPVMDGLEATKLIRGSRDGDKVKILALSAHALAEEVEEILAAGCDDFVSKPYREEKIFELMAQYLKLEYNYKTISNEEHKVVSLSVINYQQLETIPKSLLIELENAVLELHQEKIIKIIKRITERNTEIGASLQVLAENMNYTELFSILRGKYVIDEGEKYDRLSK